MKNMNTYTPTPETDTSKTKVIKNGISPLIYYCYANDMAKVERERDEARVLADRLAALLQRDRDDHGGQVVDPECDCCDCKWLKPIDEVLAAWKEARSES